MSIHKHDRRYYPVKTKVMPRKNKHVHNKGFTMVELLIGTFLASVISLAVFAVFINHVFSS